MIQLTVQPNQGTTRLDLWLVEQLPDLSRGRIQDLIAKQCVLRNGLPCRSKDPVRPGDAFSIEIPAPQSLELVATDIPLSIVYEDDCLIVIDKPQGLVVHPAAGHSDDTLVNALLAHCTDLSGINGIERPGIVHRLDKDTSGLLVVAKTDHAHQDLQRQIQAKTAQRVYRAVVWGVPRTETGTIDAPLGRHPVHRQKMTVRPDGRPARTHWRIIERLGNCTLMEFSLETGRTHQIRVHCLQNNHPVVGDPLYSSAKSPVHLEGQALHAFQLSFDHPKSGKRLSFEAPLPPDMIKLLNYLRRRIQT
jgi:23S rRNA pseudouridine1911/1915/1917 synthase